MSSSFILTLSGKSDDENQISDNILLITIIFSHY